MTDLAIGILQGNFRSCFDERHAHVAAVADRVAEMGEAEFRHNLELFKRLAHRAAEQGAQLILGPESFFDGWSAKWDVIRRVATPVPGPITRELCTLARDIRVWLCAGIFELAEQDRIYNAAVLISAAGELHGTYRKTHETKDVLSRMPYALGDDLPVFETPWGNVGMLICHDRWYPENARTLARRGAAIVLNPTATAVFHPKSEYFDIHRSVLRSHAYLNQLWWASCNAGNHGAYSVIISPMGSIAAEAGDGERVLVHRIQLREGEGYDFRSNLRDALYA